MAVHRLYLGVLYFQNVTQFYGTHINAFFIYDQNSSTAFPMPTFMKFTNVEQRDNMEISCTKFHQNRTRDERSVDINFVYALLCKVWFSLRGFSRN